MGNRLVAERIARPAFPDQRQGLLAGVHCTFQLRILGHGQHLSELGPGLVSGFDQVFTADQ
jgi:hypothetical protein